MAGTLLAAAPVAMAGESDKGAPEAVRRAVAAGEIKSLAEIMAAARDKLPGEVAGVKIEQERGRWLYEFRVVDGTGRLYEVYVDARSGKIEKIKEK
ncbi:PepSY domain-containing protein [Bradyrhizobium guangdongense]|uniref:PepSY domain-containing protein n=1 Tax=Bradyrhizobium guangdongense TaxID=1325090 RepID=UPI001FEF4F03|nr:PepSY domain-containing protein [Bradyrhizobium guangdongense]